MGHLGGGIEGKESVLAEIGDTSLRFKKGPVLPLVYKDIRPHKIRLPESFLHIAEFLMHLGAEVPGLSLLNNGGSLAKCIFKREDRRQFFIVNLD